MAQRPYTINVKDVDFPLLSKNQGNTVINDVNSVLPDSAGLPGISYCHNVMPSVEGIDSVAYKSTIAVISPAITSFSDVRVIYGSANTRLYLGLATNGASYILTAPAPSWTKLSFTFSVGIEDVTIARVRGVSYIYQKKIGCYVYNESTGTIDSVVLTSITASSVLGIVASSGYLITYDETSIAWSSVVTPLDFTPSPITGAGAGEIAGIGGKIQVIVPNSLGLLVYTDTNIVAATYTGNVQYPFKLREVSNSKGFSSLDLIGYESNLEDQFVYTKGGMQTVNSREALIILPEITDFLAGKYFEDFDESTNTFSYITLTTTMKKKLKFIGARYLIISYGVTEFTHALVYDTALKRLGKLKITHVDVFEYVGIQKEISRENIAFVLKTGEVKTLDFSSTNTTASGVVIFGKLQYVRNRFLALQTVGIKNVDSAATFSLDDLYTVDGDTYINQAGVLITSSANKREYGFDNTQGINHSLVCSGRFNLTTIYILFTIGGRF